MANERPSRPRRSSSARRSARAPARRAPAKPKQRQKRVRRTLPYEFKPDARRVSPFKSLRFTHLQWLQLLRWVCYAAMCMLCLVVQDSIMSRIAIFGATTDLAVSAMLLIAVLEGSEVGSIFILIASTVFYFSGSAPGPCCVRPSGPEAAAPSCCVPGLPHSCMK